MPETVIKGKTSEQPGSWLIALMEIQDDDPELLVQHRRHLCKNMFCVFDKYFFFEFTSSDTDGDLCVISGKVNIF